ncbi:MAG: SDR family oxidoreductase [Alphaproteobacteria bacterium]|nr:SDR family oxidoreductase [Alphaproteobacteria bacterium]
MAKVLIIGASRGIGLEAVKQALSRGYDVRAMARSADQITVDDAHLEKFAGDALNPDDVITALDYVDVVIQALGIAAGPNMVLKPVRLFSQSTEILVNAMENAGVKRLISVTGFGAGDSYARIGCLQRVPFRLLLGRAYDDKDVQERLIRRSNLDWTVARPVILTNGPRTGRYRVLAEPKQWRNGLISRADVADFLVGQIDSDDYIGKTPVLTC